jgi:ABC-type glycerol-3-phosphate transport system substrate-binding protein
MQRFRSIMMASLAMLLVLSACTGVPAAPSDGAATPAGAPAESGAEGEVTTITWLTLSWNGVEDVIAVFEAENPDINVEAEMVPFNSLFEQIQVRLGASSPEPDVISVDVPLVAGYGLRNWLLPLDDIFSNAEIEDWLDAAVEAGSYQGELLAAPVSTSTQLLFYNADLFEQAGITPPGNE